MSNVEIQKHQLRTLLRIVWEWRDPKWRDEGWMRDLAARCDLDLENPEGIPKRTEEPV